MFLEYWRNDTKRDYSRMFSKYTIFFFWGNLTYRLIRNCLSFCKISALEVA